MPQSRRPPEIGTSSDEPVSTSATRVTNSSAWISSVDSNSDATGATPDDRGYSRRKLLAIASVLAMDTPVVDSTPRLNQLSQSESIQLFVDRAKAEFATGPRPVANMWCAHTPHPMKPMAMPEKTMNG